VQLANPQWETFALHLAGGANQTEAAKRAGFSSGAANQGSRLAKYPQIAARVAELKAAVQTTSEAGCLSPEEFHVSRPFIVNKLVETHEDARKAKQFSVCVNAMLALAKIGKLIDSTPGPSRVTQVNVSGLTPAQMNQVLRESLGQLPATERKQISGELPELSEVIDVEALECESSSINQGGLAVDRES